MKTLFTTLLSLCLLAIAAHAQPYNFSATTGDVSLSGSGTSFTIQQPAINAKQVQLNTAVVYCSVACNLTQAQNGAAATATPTSSTGLMPLGPAAVATVWTASNVGGGIAAGGILHLAAGERVTLDMSHIVMGNEGTSANYTFVISSITGTANISLFWSER